MGPCTANAQRPTVESQCRGTHHHLLCGWPETLPANNYGDRCAQSTRYCRALPCRHLCMMTPSLYVTWYATSSQCKSSCKIWVGPWSNFLVSLTTRAAAFITRCRVSVNDFMLTNWQCTRLSFDDYQVNLVLCTATVMLTSAVRFIHQNVQSDDDAKNSSNWKDTDLAYEAG